MQENTSDRFAGLDLLRGLAALAVLFFHCWSPPIDVAWPPAFLNPFPRAYLAVDLFFVLSGFVIAHAYSRRLGSGGQLRLYLIARLIRLYPLYLAATLMVAVEMFAALSLGHNSDPHIRPGQLLQSLATAVLFLPTPIRWSVSPPLLFPLVFTAWSLLWELLVNLLYGVGARRLRGVWLAVPVVLGGLGLCLAVHLYGTTGPGGYWDGWWVGAVRALFSFFAGVALFRLRKHHRAPSLPLPILAAALLLALAPGWTDGGLYDLACIVLLFPLLVWFGAEASMGSRLRDFSLLAGYISYPVYLLQAPLLWTFGPLSVRLTNLLPTIGPREAIVQIYPFLVILGSWFIARWFDSPVRDWLRRRFLHRPVVLGAQSAP